ncbi:MAG TPA: type II secretion system protein M [Steroidobacteraceae bacterium]
MNKLRAWYDGLQQREQRMVSFGGVVVAVLLLLFGLLMPLQSAVSNAVARNAAKREDLAWMQVNATEVRAAGGAVATDTGEAPVVLVDRVGRESGLGNALRGTQPNGTGVRVQLEAAPFDTLVAWLATLDEHYGLAVESITVDRAARPGIVNASITFSQPRH